MIEEAIEAFLQPLSGYAPLFVFVVSFIGSLIAFIPIPYFPLLSVLALTYEPISLIASASIGSSLAKLIIFMVSFWGGKKIGEKRRDKMKPLLEIVKKYGWIAAFLAAATPIPDDMIYIPLGVLRYNPYYFFISTFLGKVIINTLVILGTKWTLPIVFYFIESTPSSLWLPITILLITVTILIIYVIMSLDWNKVSERFGIRII